MQAGSRIRALIASSVSRIWVILAARTTWDRTGREAVNTASRPRYRELITEKKDRISVPTVEMPTAEITIRSARPIGGWPMRSKRSIALVSRKNIAPPRYSSRKTYRTALPTERFRSFGSRFFQFFGFRSE